MSQVQIITNYLIDIMDKDTTHSRNLLDNFLHKSGDTIITQRKLEKSRINSTVSKNTHDKFLDFVKRNHGGMIKGPYSFELERAIMFYLYFFDNN